MVFCHECGFDCQNTFKFCPQCGTQASASIGASSQQPPRASSSAPTSHLSTDAFLDAAGEPTPLFTKYASAVLNALDAAVEPKGTGWIEMPKLVHLEKIASIAGQSELHGLPQDLLLKMFQMFGCEAHMVPVGQTSEQQVALTRAGAMSWLRLGILHDPDEQLGAWVRILRGLQLNLPSVQRSMLPAAPNKEIVALVEKFQAELQALVAAVQAHQERDWQRAQENIRQARQMSSQMNAARSRIWDSALPSSTRVEYRYGYL